MLPVLWIGLVAFGALMAARDLGNFILIPIIMTVFVFFLGKKLIWDLADEVYDCVDSLMIRKRGEEERIALSNIMNVSESTYLNPPRVTLRLVHPSRFGNEIAFSPIAPFTLNPFAKNQVAQDLMARVDQARSTRAT